MRAALLLEMVQSAVQQEELICQLWRKTQAPSLKKPINEGIPCMPSKKSGLPAYLAAAAEVRKPPKKDNPVCKKIAPHLKAHRALRKED